MKCLLEGCENQRKQTIHKDGRTYLMKGCSLEHSKRINAVRSGMKQRGRKKVSDTRVNERQEKLEQKGYTILEIPGSSRDKVTFQCPECGVEFKRTFHNAMLPTAKTVCPECSKQNFNQHLKKTWKTSMIPILDHNPSAKDRVQAVCECGVVFKRRLADIVHLNQTKCLKCGLHQGVSEQEKQFHSWVECVLQRPLIQSYRGWCPENRQLEIDIFDPVTNIGIEFNGEWFHSIEKQKNSQTHRRKFRMAESAGIHLITLFSHEIDLNSDVFQKRVMGWFGKFNQVLDARKLKLLDDVSMEFHQENHIQGSPHHVIDQCGLFLDDQCVIAATWSRHPRKSDEMVLSRLTTKAGVRVRGGASRLIKQFDGSFKTWSDNRFSTGKVYRSLGFEFVEEQKADYFYWSRKTGKVSKQSMKGPNEAQRAIESGLMKIYDCGKRVWRK